MVVKFQVNPGRIESKDGDRGVGVVYVSSSSYRATAKVPQDSILMLFYIIPPV